MECGIPSIDSDRMRVIDIYNLAEKTPPEMLCCVFQYNVVLLIRSLFTSMFIKEEDLMREVRYPWSVVHKAEHSAVIAGLEARIKTYQSDVDPTAIIAAVTEFVDTHFMGRDAGLMLAIRMTLDGARPQLPPGSKRQ